MRKLPALGVASALFWSCATPPATRPSVEFRMPGEGVRIEAGASQPLWLDVQNFQFIDWRGATQVPGQGHYRLYLDDAVGASFLLESFRRDDAFTLPLDTLAGDHTLRAALVSNDGSELVPPAEATRAFQVGCPTPECVEGAGGRTVIITEIVFDPVDTRVELTNIGTAPQSMDLWTLCQYPNYWELPSGFTIPPGGRIVVHGAVGTNDPLGDPTDMWFDGSLNTWGTLDPNVAPCPDADHVNGMGCGDLGLYRDFVDFPDFGNPAKIVSYVQWTSGFHKRDIVAWCAGIWLPGTHVDLTGLRSGDGLRSDESGICIRHYCREAQSNETLGLPNTGGPCP